MKPQIFFKVSTLLPLIAHAKSAEEQRITYDQRYEFKNGQLVEIENPTAPRGLIFVKDEGAYLLSNGKIPQTTTYREAGLIVYAEGMDPAQNDNAWIYARSLLGGDDFAITIELEMFEKTLEDTQGGYLVLEVTEEDIGFGWTPNIPTRKR